MTLLRLQPLEMFNQLGNFDNQRHRQVFRRMELIPITFIREIAQTLLYLFE